MTDTGPSAQCLRCGGVTNPTHTCLREGGTVQPDDPDRCEDCGGRFIRGTHFCFGGTESRTEAHP